jgi:hypothetical protein
MGKNIDHECAYAFNHDIFLKIDDFQTHKQGRVTECILDASNNTIFFLFF